MPTICAFLFFNLTKSEFHQILCADSQGEFLTAISLKFLKFEITKSPTVSDLYIGIVLVYKFDGDIAARPGLDKLSVRDPRRSSMKLPPEQQAIRAKCFHPSGTFVEFPIEDVETSIPARFEKVANIFPNRVAVKSLDKKLTYSELNKAANRLARSILARCETSQVPIGVMLPKSVDLVSAVLGVLKAGKICMIMDTALPLDRLSAMLDDTQTQWIVTNQQEEECLTSLVDPNHTFNIEALVKRGDPANVELSIRADSLAFIFHTSGSTGRAKEIVENHRNLLHYTMTETNDYHICSSDKLTLMGLRGLDIFRALLNGAAVFPIELRQTGFVGLARLLIDEEITIYSSAVSIFRQFTSSLVEGDRFPHLRVIKVMGETAYRKDFELFCRRFSNDCIFVNSYAPSETGLISQYLMDKTTRVLQEGLPAGYVTRDKNVVVVSDSGARADFGQTGEIVVSSSYLSPGYWRDPDRTSEKFGISSADDKERVFRTGDLGATSEDGCLVHLGRVDFQVKIRGNKVDPSEVESALLTIGGIRQAAVVARKHEDAENTRLIAYIVTNGLPSPADELRRFLATKLPDYSIPSVFVVLDAMPLTPNGKLDRAALPVPNSHRPLLTTLFAAPRSSIEETLTKIWTEVLRLEQVGIHDNFFDLGGHSLAAMRLVSRVIKQFQLELPLQSLFQSPTVAEMATIIMENQAKLASDAELAHMLREVEAMTEEEVQRRLEGINSPIANK